jgi:hypothetical protein
MFLLTMEGCDEEMLSKKVASAPSPTATTAIGDPTLPALAMAHGAPASAILPDANGTVSPPAAELPQQLRVPLRLA